MSRKRHTEVVRTKKFAVEVCNEDRKDFIVVRLFSDHGMVHHHFKPKEALLLAHGILKASTMPR